MITSYVYWIYDDECTSLENSGYIGVSLYPIKRFKHHKKKNINIHEKCNLKILYEGDRESCFNFEKKLRPKKGIGWNNAVGGSHGYRCGFTHSIETKEKLKNAWNDERKLKASKLRKKLNKKKIGIKRPKHSKAMLGKNNPMYGTIRPDYVKNAVSEANKKRIPVNKIELYCIFCHKRVPPSRLDRHGIGKKECIDE